MEEPEQHINTTEARQGTTPHMARGVLVWGTLICVIAFIVILMVFW